MILNQLNRKLDGKEEIRKEKENECVKRKIDEEKKREMRRKGGIKAEMADLRRLLGSSDIPLTSPHHQHRQQPACIQSS